MRLKNLTFLTLAFGLLCGTAGAQTPPGLPGCQMVPEAIITLNQPVFGVPAVWDATFGDETKLIQFAAAVPLGNGNVLAAGDQLDENFQSKETVLVELNRRGRGIGEKHYPAEKAEKTTSLVPVGSGYVMGSNVKGGARADEKWVRLSWYDSTRTYLRDLTLKDAAYDYESYGLREATDKNGFIAIIHAVSRKDENDQYGMLFRISSSGAIVWKRAYRPGISNLIQDLAPTGDGAFMASGRILNEDGRMAGWILKLNGDGTIAWQRVYPRGIVAMLRRGYARDKNRTVFAGQVTPFGDEFSSAWVMEVDTLGEIVWQRYFPMGGYETDGRGVTVHADNRTTVMVNAKASPAAGPDARNHIRLVTLSPRGEMLGDEPYIEGKHAMASQLSVGQNNERIVTASFEESNGEDMPEDVVLITDQIQRKQGKKTLEAETGQLVEAYVEPENPVEETKEKTTDDDGGPAVYKGWVFAATPPEPYRDPCLPPDIPKASDR